MTTQRTTDPMPGIVDRATWQAELDGLLVREKAHTRESDQIAAARRRLPMVEVDASTPLIGAQGRVPLVDVFEGRRQLIVYLHMWHDGKPAAKQCEGCTFFTGHARELSYLHSRDVTYATFCQGSYEESARYRDFMGWEMPWYSARDSRPMRYSPAATLAPMSAICATVTGSSRRTGPPVAAWRPAPPVTTCSISPCTADRKPGRSRRKAGRSRTPRPASSSAPVNGRLRSGTGSLRAAPMISQASRVRERCLRG